MLDIFASKTVGIRGNCEIKREYSTKLQKCEEAATSHNIAEIEDTRSGSSSQTTSLFVREELKWRAVSGFGHFPPFAEVFKILTR